MRRGDIYLVDLEPAGGSEANKRRPAIIVTNEGANSRAALNQRGILTVLPVTSNIEHVLPFHVLLPKADTGLPKDSKAQAEYIRAVSVDRFGTYLGTVGDGLMGRIDDAIRLHLSL
ncbi:type II toxin-antitoxin system PemK/MazF family toxin [Nesterenkonia sp. MY13]|uniref:mRNA interferase n=1 Tax=Nesterenkonia sedimenti TaxID=1463632 RepID=A0A7X8TI43_9MICC|nr:type II toxin-antitoxin system PemK/MazF family toxin [Nesterenkonia sedimenti]NLS09171.1 type II toxin-antitoxin system PemK/MazF family toxin [Nesterenkonia sedimenti]